MKTGFKILILIGVTLIAFGLSFISQALLLPFLVLTAFMAAEWGLWYALPVAGAVAAGSFISFGTDPGGLASLAMLLAALVVMIVYGKKRFPHRYCILALTAVLTVGMYLAMTLTSILNGQKPHAEVVAFFTETIAEPLTSLLAADAAAEASLAEYFSELESLIPDILMPMSLLTAELYALLMILLYRLFSKMFRVEPAPMAKLSEWRLPRTAHWGSLILIAIIAACCIIGFERAAAIALSLGIPIVSMFALQGFCFLLFMLSVPNAPKFMRILLFVFTLILFPYSLVFLMFFGISEQVRPRRAQIVKMLDDMAREEEERREEDELDKYGYIRGDRKNDDENNDKENE
ncbi:MAG: DUF2232 domain-containing protein [Clostridia bacterium]|nr:DUF2232 domain-containing protein [Clostridia bacterium]